MTASLLHTGMVAMTTTASRPRGGHGGDKPTPGGAVQADQDKPAPAPADNNKSSLPTMTESGPSIVTGPAAALEVGSGLSGALIASLVAHLWLRC